MTEVYFDDETLYLPDSLEQEEEYSDNDEKSFLFDNMNTTGQLTIYSIDEFDALPIYDMTGLREMIRSEMDDDQGLIEAERGETEGGNDYVYVIIKTGEPDDECAYTLFLEIFYVSQVIHIQGVFEETGISGIRAKYVYEKLREEGIIGPDGEGWTKDPYDDSEDTGFLMDLSEDRKFDGEFPLHPLSVIRELTAEICREN
ncbi:MAG: hypothetical protein IJM62_06105 [Lachnospiraceae bacterium]|nr:hypothetical protein [Lachnospiraceae bacterium]